LAAGYLEVLRSRTDPRVRAELIRHIAATNQPHLAHESAVNLQEVGRFLAEPIALAACMLECVRPVTLSRD
jgi:hypothetical protein